MSKEQYNCPGCCFFSLKPCFRSNEKERVLNKKDSILCIDSTGIKVSQDANKNKNNQEKSVGYSKIGLATNLNLWCTFSCPVVFRLSSGNSHDAPERRKLIESICPKNNNYFLMDRAYEDDKTLASARIIGLRQLFHLKKNHKLPWSYDKHLYKQRNNIERCFLRLKRFGKVFARYNKFDSICISIISLVFIFDLLFM